MGDPPGQKHLRMTPSPAHEGNLFAPQQTNPRTGRKRTFQLHPIGQMRTLLHVSRKTNSLNYIK